MIILTPGRAQWAFNAGGELVRGAVARPSADLTRTVSTPPRRNSNDSCDTNNSGINLPLTSFVFHENIVAKLRRMGRMPEDSRKGAQFRNGSSDYMSGWNSGFCFYICQEGKLTIRRDICQPYVLRRPLLEKSTFRLGGTWGSLEWCGARMEAMSICWLGKRL